MRIIHNGFILDVLCRKCYTWNLQQWFLVLCQSSFRCCILFDPDDTLRDCLDRALSPFHRWNDYLIVVTVKVKVWSWQTGFTLQILPTFVLVKSLQSCLTLCNPVDCSLPGSSVHGILQARILEWVAMSFSRGIVPIQGSNPCLLCLLHWQMSSLPLEPLGKPILLPTLPYQVVGTV